MPLPAPIRLSIYRPHLQLPLNRFETLGNPTPPGVLISRAERDDAWARLVGATATEPFCRAWLQVLASRIGELERALLLTADESGVFRPMSTWPADADVADLSGAARKAVESRELVIEPIEYTGGARLAFPIELRETLSAALILQTGPQSAQQRTDALREVHWASAWLHLTLTGASEVDASASATAGRKVLEALTVMQGRRSLFECCLSLANHLAPVFGNARVCVGVHRRDRTELVAISATAWFERRSKEIVDLENALEEATDQRRSTVVPPIPGQRPAVTAALAAAIGPRRAGCVVVLGGSSAFGSGALLVERSFELPFSRDEMLQLEQIARWAGPVLELSSEGDRWFAGKPARLWQGLLGHLRDPRRPTLRWGMALATLLLAALALVPAQRRVTAEAVVEGGRELVLTAPFDGYVGSAMVKAGQMVKVGTVLAEMDRRELALENERREAGRVQQERRFVDAMAKRDRAAAGVARAAMDEADAQLGLTRHRLERAQIRAEVDAVVIAGDLSQQIGSPLKQGQVLFKLAPLDDYRVILKVDERDILQVREKQSGDLLLAGASGQSLRFEVRNIAAAEAGDGQNRFRVEAKVLGTSPPLRPGMEGVGKIETDMAPLLAIWTRRALQWARLAWFQFWP